MCCIYISFTSIFIKIPFNYCLLGKLFAKQILKIFKYLNSFEIDIHQCSELQDAYFRIECVTQLWFIYKVTQMNSVTECCDLRCLNLANFINLITFVYMFCNLIQGATKTFESLFAY